MDRDEFFKVVEAVKVMPLRPQDVLVIRVHSRIPAEFRERIKHHITEALGLPNKVFVDGAQIEIVRPEAVCAQ